MFLVFAVVNNAAESIHMPDFCVDTGFFLGCICRGGISGSSDNSVQCFEELLDCVPRQVTIPHPQRLWTSFRFLHSLAGPRYWLFEYSHSDGCETVPDCGFSLHLE